MKVLDESGKGISPGSRLDLRDLGLPVTGRQATLIVFWKGL